MRDPIVKTYEVEGDGAFPFDMLRQDRSWPERAVDVAAIAHEGLRRVRLATMAIYSPTRSQWNRTGWKVMD